MKNATHLPSPLRISAIRPQRILVTLLFVVQGIQGCTCNGDIFVDPVPHLSGNEGIIIAETPSGFVTLTSKKKPARSLHDGEHVTYVRDNIGPGMGADSTAEVIVAKKRGTVPNDSLILEDRLSRSPYGPWAIFHAVDRCDDECGASITLLYGFNDRKSVGGGGLFFSVAWRADGKQVAIGSGVLHMVSLLDRKIWEYQDLTSPTYSPDSILFARGNGDDVFEVSNSGDKRMILRWPGSPPESSLEDQVQVKNPVPIKFLNAKEFEAIFTRNGDDILVTADLSGRVINSHPM